MNELFEKVEAFQNMLIEIATGGTLRNDDYQNYRQELINNHYIKGQLPEFVRDSLTAVQFWHFIKNKFQHYKERKDFLWDAFKPILLKLETFEYSYKFEIDSTIERINSESILHDWEKANDRKFTDPEGAITMARTLIEITCKHILVGKGIQYEDDIELPKLYKMTSLSLNLSPEQHHEKIFHQILGGIKSVVEGLGSLRNKFSDAHGNIDKVYKPSIRHSELAVNLAGSLCKFLLETYKLNH